MSDADVYVAYSMLVIFLTLGAVLPFVQAEYGQTVTSNDVENFEGDIRQGQTVSNVTGWTVIKSVAGMLFFTFGQVPFILDALLLLPLRVLMWFVIIRNLPFFG